MIILNKIDIQYIKNRIKDIEIDSDYLINNKFVKEFKSDVVRVYLLTPIFENTIIRHLEVVTVI